METMTLTITAQTLNAIGAGLNELPYKVAAPAIQEIQKQVEAHLAEKANARNTGPKDSEVGDSNGT